MKSAVLLEYGQPLSIETIAAPDLWDTAVRVRVDASGVCHSDLLIADGDIPFPLPVILGHEGAGTVVEVGRSVGRVRVGDRVVCSFIPACGDCWFCLHGRSNLCEGLIDTMLASRGTRTDGSSVFGMSGLGTFGDELVTDQAMVVPVRTDLPAEQLALIGCGVTTGVGAVLNQARVEPGASVAVFGCGGVGQAVVQGARIAGAARIFAVDPLDHKRAAAAAFGATDLVDPAAADPVDSIRAGTHGTGCGRRAGSHPPATRCRPGPHACQPRPSGWTAAPAHDSWSSRRDAVDRPSRSAARRCGGAEALGVDPQP